MRLVLWDIDHTLIETGGVGSEVFHAAFHQVTGQPMRDSIDPTGQTEPTIFRRTLEAHHLTDPGDYFPRFAQAQADGYRARAADLRHRGRALPGAAAALRTCARTPDVVQTILTGNTRASAAAKLDILGLARYVDLTIGAYGDDHPDRPQLVPLAQHRASEKYHHPFTAAETVIIGDTPADIHTAHANGTHVIAVATGSTNRKQLHAAGAHTVFDDLTNTTALLETILTDA